MNQHRKTLPLRIMNRFLVHCWHNSFASIAVLDPSYWGWFVNNQYNFYYERRPRTTLFNWHQSWLTCQRTDDIFASLSGTLEIEAYYMEGSCINRTREYIESDCYSFILCNRFFQPNHFECGIVHNYHFNLIYGYDSLNKSFQVLSDWRYKDVLEPFVLSYEGLDQSKVAADTVNFGVEEFRNNIITIRRKDVGMQYCLDRSSIHHNLTELLNGREDDERVIGIQAIASYVKDLPQLFAELFEVPDLIKAFLTPTFFAYNGHVRNMYLLHYLLKSKWISSRLYHQLLSSYSVLRDKWQIVMMVILRSQNKTLDLESIQRRMAEIYDLEMSAADQFERSLRGGIV